MLGGRYAEGVLSRPPAPAYPAGFIERCVPTPSRAVPDGSRWAFGVKHDGFRFIARRDGDRVHTSTTANG